MIYWLMISFKLLTILTVGVLWLALAFCTTTQIVEMIKVPNKDLVDKVWITALCSFDVLLVVYPIANVLEVL